jgi:hypothetical protein
MTMTGEATGSEAGKKADRVETAAGRRMFEARWGRLDGVLYLPRTSFSVDEPPIYCQSDGERVFSLRHVNHPDCFTLLSNIPGALQSTVEEGYGDHRCTGAQLQGIAAQTTAVLVDGSLKHGRRWLVRPWEEAPALFKSFGEPWPTVEAFDLSRVLSSRLMGQKEEDGAWSLAVANYNGRECITLRDEAPGEDDATLRGGGRWELAHPGDVERARATGWSVVLMGDLLESDPWGIWLVFGPNSPREVAGSGAEG